MKRARKKNGSSNNTNSVKDLKRREYKYESDMTELGYDPDTFAENEDDISARPEIDEQDTDTDMENDTSADGTYEDTPDEDAADNINSDEYAESDIAAKTSKKTIKKKPLIFIVSLFTIVAIFFVALGLGGFFVSPKSEEEITEDYVVPVDKATGKINVLILGVDKDGLRTDTIIVACYNLDENKVDLLSIPRDTRMYIGNKYQKINAAHAISQSGKIKGPQGSIEAVTRLTGIPINYYVEFSFDAFKNTIDALGGVDFDVPRDMNYEDPVQDLYIHLKKGYQHLDGDMAEQLVRFRRYPQGDIARVEMQQAFLKAVAEQKLNMSIVSSLPDLFNVLKDDIDTNFSILDITKYINNLKELSPENIRMFQLPGQFSGAEYTASYWLPDMDQLKLLIESEFNYDAVNATIHSEDKSSVSKENADKKATNSPTAKSSSPASHKTQTPAKTKKPSNATAKPSHSVEPTKKPSATNSHIDKETAKPTDKPSAATDKPQTEKPQTAKPTEPARTEKPTEKPTERPARPTPNATAVTED